MSEKNLRRLGFDYVVPHYANSILLINKTLGYPLYDQEEMTPYKTAQWYEV